MKLALALALAASAPAQEVLDVRLRADSAGDGPPALVWARQLLAKLCPVEVDVRAGLRVRIGPDGVHAQQDTAPLAAGTYFVGYVTTLRGDVVILHCDDTGLETWRGAVAACAPAQALLRASDALRALGSIAVCDMPVLAGCYGTGLTTESPAGLALTVGAAECGELLVRAQGAGTAWRVEGRSRGGLTWPALLLALARRSAGSTSDEDRFIALAYAARDDRRQEAAMQLARFASAASARCLQSLLHADGETKARAIESLARRGLGSALPAMVAAGAGDPACAPALSAALATLWPGCPEDVRQAVRQRAGADPLLHALLDRAVPAVARAGWGAEPVRSLRAAPSPARTLLPFALLASLLVLFSRVLRGVVNQRIS